MVAITLTIGMSTSMLISSIVSRRDTMASSTRARFLWLALFASATIAAAAGWDLRADAGQNSRRPNVPRPSDVRPAAPAQQPATGSPAPPGPGPRRDTDQKQAGLDGEDGFYDEKTGVATAKDFI